VKYENLRVDEPLVEAGPDLTPQSLIQLHYHAPPAGLQPLFTTLFALECRESRIVDTMPAGVGYVFIMLEGTGTLRFASGRVDHAHPEFVLAPTSAAVGLEVQGPMRVAAVALSPIGWAALTGRDAARWADRADEAGGILGDSIHAVGDRLRAGLHDGTLDDEQQVQLLAAHLATLLRPVDPRHVDLARKVSDWLSSSFDPALADLQAKVDYSPRQLQRLIGRLFGCSAKHLMRKYRALRVAALLQAPDVPDERIAQLLNLFYDQSHMIREIRHFTGRTPQRLLSGDDSLLAAASGIHNYTGITPNIARMPKD
jgi:AraC-like DNA-binding protein